MASTMGSSIVAWSCSRTGSMLEALKPLWGKIELEATSDTGDEPGRENVSRSLTE